MKLDIGCGPIVLEGYQGIDFCYGPIFCDIESEPLPYPDNSVDEARCVHSLEHCSHRSIPFVLGQVFRVLAPGGKLFVEVPDLDYVFRKWLTEPSDYLLWCVYGDQWHLAQPDKARLHKCGFNLARLVERFIQAGFQILIAESVYSPRHEIDVVRVTGGKP